MVARRLKMDRLLELVRLHRLGTGAREVARLLQMSPNTERRYREALQAAQLLDGPVEPLPELSVLKTALSAQRPVPTAPKQEVSKIAPFRPVIKSMMDDGLSRREIHRRLKKQPDFKGSYAQIKRMVKGLRKAAGVRPEDVAIPVDTDPGEVVQVDFGYVGKLLDPATMTLRKAYVFVGVMGYSRLMFARLVFDQKVETWVRLHVQMFDALGGVPKVVVPDNLKAAVIRAAFTAADETTLNRSYRELGRYYGFKIDPTPPYSPQKKGKVESGVKYLKNSVLKAREAMCVVELQDELDVFVRDIANVREHGTTFRPPIELFEEERGEMRALPPERYDPITWHEAKVHRDCHVQFRRRRYSVPWKHVGESVWLRATGSDVLIYADDERIATHARQDGAGKAVTNESHLPDQRSEYRQRSQSYWQERAERLGEDVGAFIQEVWDSDDVLHQLRTVQAIVKLLSGYPPHRAKAAAKRALFYGVLDYRGVKNILVNALDLEPLPVSTPVVGTLSQPRFARRIDELMVVTPEGHAHGPN